MFQSYVVEPLAKISEISSRIMVMHSDVEMLHSVERCDGREHKIVLNIVCSEGQTLNEPLTIV